MIMRPKAITSRCTRTSPTRHARAIDIRFSLFGPLSVQIDDEVALDHAPLKVQELLCYLLLHRDKAHPREALADALWGEYESIHSRKYLRQSLWQLHAGVPAPGAARLSSLIRQRPAWIELHLDDAVWVDSVELENVFHSVRGKCPLHPDDVPRVVQAVQLYRGDLLQGVSAKWCIAERERFREMYLVLLDKVVDYCERSGQCEAGIAFGSLALRADPARERAHRTLISLRYRSGDRIGAIRQYERCAAALKEELDVAPSREVQELYEAICAGHSLTKGRTITRITPLVFAETSSVPAPARRIAAGSSRSLPSRTR
jgi:DNA-binding SARP family transcriptional activator